MNSKPSIPAGVVTTPGGSMPSQLEEATPRTRHVYGARHWRWWGLAPLLLLPVGAFLLPQVFAPPPANVTQQPPLPVATVTLTPDSSYAIPHTYTGEIVARRSSALGLELGGTVTALWVDEGDWVQQGQPLAQVDTRNLQAQRQQLVAQRDQAVAQLQELEAGPRQEDLMAARAVVADLEQQVALSQAQMARRQDLYHQGAISREELDQVSFGTGSLQSRLEQAQSQVNELVAGTRPEQIAAQAARVRQLEASLATIDVDLAKSTLKAPFDGRISQRLVDEGGVVNSGQPLLTLVEAGALEARIGVPTDVAPTLTIGKTYPLQIHQQSLQATVTALLPELEATSRTVTVVLTLEADAAVTVGQTARLVLNEIRAEDGFWLPTTALTPGERGLWSVYVLANEVASAAAGSPSPAHYTVARRDVEVVYTDGDRVFVRGMVQAGEVAIASGVHRIVPGQIVAIATSPAPGDS